MSTKRKAKNNKKRSKTEKITSGTNFIANLFYWDWNFHGLMSSARIKEIEEQLSHLKWRRLQNDRAIKASLEASQSMLQKDSILQMSVDRAG